MPPQRLSTGVAVYTVFRQTGSAVGTAAWVAAIGTASLAASATSTVGWWVIAGGAVLGLAALTSVAARTAARATLDPVETRD